jgi:Protein of unknown function (DUF2846)
MPFRKARPQTSLPTFTQMQSSAPPLAANTGRIFVYRTLPIFGCKENVQPPVLATPDQPVVKVDGHLAGESKRGGYFFVDLPAGSHTISTQTEVLQTASLTLEPGQTRYVRLTPSIGLVVAHISPEPVDEQQALTEIKECHYTGG